MSLFEKAKKARENKKGFTLVELIVVLVILAILAAMLVPALLGWIDEAKKKNYELEARSVYMAAQAVADELYATDTAMPASFVDSATEKNLSRVKELATDVDVRSVSGISAPTGATGRDLYKIAGMTTQFKSGNGKLVTMQLKDNKWTKTAETDDL